MHYLCELSANFMVIQYFSFRWEKVDAVVTLRGPLKEMLLKREPTKQIAKELARSLKIPYCRLSKKKLQGKRVLVVDLTLDRLELVRELARHYEMKDAYYFSLLKS